MCVCIAVPIWWSPIGPVHGELWAVIHRLPGSRVMNDKHPLFQPPHAICWPICAISWFGSLVSIAHVRFLPWGNMDATVTPLSRWRPFRVLSLLDYPWWDLGSNVGLIEWVCVGGQTGPALCLFGGWEQWWSYSWAPRHEICYLVQNGKIINIRQMVLSKHDQGAWWFSR